MASSTISRTTLVDDSGTPSAPVGDGQIWDNAQLQLIYDAIDEMLAGAGAYATLTLGGMVAAEGFGSHTFFAGGTGANTVAVRNTVAGTGNLSRFQLGNDAQSDIALFDAYSSTYASAGPIVANGVALRGRGAGGMSLSAEHASGDMRWYARGTTKKVTFDGENLTFSGGAVGTVQVPGIIDVNTTQVGTDADTSTKTLATKTLDAALLDTNGMSLDVVAWGTQAAHATNSKNLQLHFGSTVVVGLDLVNNSSREWVIRATVIRSGATAQKSVGEMRIYGSPGNESRIENVENPTETLSGTVVVKVTGKNSVAQASSLVFEGWRITVNGAAS